MVLGIASFGGFDLNRVKGEWTLSTIDGKPASDKAVELGLPSYALLNNYSIGDKAAISAYYPNAGEVKTTAELSVEAAVGGEMLFFIGLSVFPSEGCYTIPLPLHCNNKFSIDI